MGDYNGPRRYYLRKAQQAYRDDNWELGAAWRAKQLALVSEALPETFPYVTLLREFGYFAREDLNGADALELTRACGLMQREAEAVIAAYGALPA